MIEINISAVIDYMLSIFEELQSITVKIGDFETDLLAIELMFILVDIIIYFITTFTNPGGDD